ncbi:hypothetical protein PPSIR1_19589 [Plesiocystis pacifica SIR-1]|uniref:Cupin domain-containing protein n=1 Tax=Plesiocystis pacifica SIR-1 TaxID=391625 RepID=A6GAL7_9BACT|nr:hypothetical protein [Plesiocystis pacifica]EDM77079.1 hypothetical protein PPSIR1_19589 [Plesiocystis pacifica SIR-1]
MADGMIPVLIALEAQLPALLEDLDAWQTLDITYHPPHVERLWMQRPEGRVFLHRIEACEPGEALFHPHDWPSAMKILAGRYEHGVGAAIDGEVQTLSVARLSAGTYYEMTNPRTYHWVRPLEEVHTLMLAGPLYAERPRFPKPDARQGPLTPERKRALAERFGALLSS